MHNPDKVQRINSLLNTDKIQTDFNRNLYEYFCSRIIKQLDPLMNITADFSADEVAKIVQITSSYSKSVSTAEAMREYIKTINEESEKLSKEEVANASPAELLEKIKKMKDKHNDKE